MAHTESVGKNATGISRTGDCQIYFLAEEYSVS